MRSCTEKIMETTDKRLVNHNIEFSWETKEKKKEQKCDKIVFLISQTPGQEGRRKKQLMVIFVEHEETKMTMYI